MVEIYQIFHLKFPFFPTLCIIVFYFSTFFVYMWVSWVKNKVILDMENGLSFTKYFLKLGEKSSITQQSA